MINFSKFSRIAGAAALSGALLVSASSAFASEDGRNTAVGAVAGGLLTHGSAGGIIGGAVVGGVAGHVLSDHHKHYRHYRHDDYCRHHYCR